MNLFVRKSLYATSSPCFNLKNPIFCLQFFSSTTASQNASPKSNAIADYFVTSCGFSEHKAALASKYFANRRFPSNPDSVRHFFKHHGFTDTHIRSIIANFPGILSADAVKILEPNLQAIRKTVNFTYPELQMLVVANPQVLTYPRALSRVEFWKTFLNNDRKRFLSVLTRNPGLITQDIDTGIAPKIALLKNYGLSSLDIGMLLGTRSKFIRRSTASMEDSLKRVQELGFARGSSMFVLALLSVGSTSTDTFKAKMEIFKLFGWSECMFFAALKKFPTIVVLSEKNIREKMEFLVETAGCTQNYIALHPAILGFSLEKRLIPRHQVLKVLKSNELVGREWDIYTVMSLTERKFLERIIFQHKEIMPNLYETYVAVQPHLS